MSQEKKPAQKKIGPPGFLIPVGPGTRESRAADWHNTPNVNASRTKTTKLLLFSFALAA
jgi:hypothetical protein